MATVLSTTFPSIHGKSVSKKLSKGKAKEILKHGEVRGRKLTRKQRGLFGAIAGGSSSKFPPTPKYSARGKLNKY